MLRKWTWLLPCWVWLWGFMTTSKSSYRVVRRREGEDKTIHLTAFRIDDDFVLVRDPMPRRSRTPWSIRMQRWRERRLLERKRKLESKLFQTKADLRIEELDEED